MDHSLENNQQEINKKKIRVAKVSLFAAFFMVFIKLIAAYFSGSLAVLSDVFHSSIDILATVITIISIKISARPADDDHHYGHEKVESFSALVQVILLVAICSYFFYESINRLFFEKGHVVTVSIWTFAAIIIAMTIDFTRVKVLRKTAKETNSPALEADAAHFFSDLLSSVVVLISLVFTYFNISKIADSISALIVAIIILYTGLKLSKKAIDSLMDRVPAGLSDKIKYETRLVQGVEDIKSFRIRSTGSKIFIDMIITISRLVPFSKAHEIMDSVERRIKQISPNTDVVIHSEPVETKDETINEKIRMIVNDFDLKCHDIFSHKIEDQIFTELHVEISDTDDLKKAHDIISDIEERIKKEISVISDVKIHIDEPSELLYDTMDITDRSRELLRYIKNILDSYNSIENYCDIKVLTTSGKIRVSLNCEFDLNLSFEQVHDHVTLLESKIYLSLKELYPNLSNVIIHAEPKDPA